MSTDKWLGSRSELTSCDMKLISHVIENKNSEGSYKSALMLFYCVCTYNNKQNF